MGWKRISLEDMFSLAEMGVPTRIAKVRLRHSRPGHKVKPTWEDWSGKSLRPFHDCHKFMAGMQRTGWTYIFSVEVE